MRAAQEILIRSLDFPPEVCMAYRREIGIKAGTEFLTEPLPVYRSPIRFKQPEILFEFFELLHEIPPLPAFFLQ